MLKKSASGVLKARDMRDWREKRDVDGFGFHLVYPSRSSRPSRAVFSHSRPSPSVN